MNELSHDLDRLVRDLVASAEGTDSDNLRLWNEVRELGLDRVGISEARGGSGGTIDDLVSVVAAFGHHGLPLPVVENAAANFALAQLADLRPGWATITVADRRLARSGSRWSGVIDDVPWLATAPTLVIVLGDSGGALVADAAACTQLVNSTRSIAGEPLASCRFDAAQLQFFDLDTDKVMGHWRLLETVSLLGSARAAYLLTKEYVTNREQFGKPLLKIPSVAANLALMSVQLMLAEAALGRLRCQDPRTPDLEAARVITAEAASTVARIAHQLHGAIGTTLEYPLHRLTKSIWARRDRTLSQHAAARSLGQRALAGGEQSLWNTLTGGRE